MPIITPGLVFCEKGCVQVFYEDSQPFLVVSTDRRLRLNKELSSTKVAVEIKCPLNGVHTFSPVSLLFTVPSRDSSSQR
ncbi:hypothetical protein DPMN_089507 [Dreissena polymorpha]|uniref:Uncharacterized protein n=1 Tax=Dreissena polymorpha TaxID=45954 RepID=A0A9D4KW37_DREPO|nr:hypothetical protein DPMN_089507 [Dreissena polymorpha]